MIHTESSHRHAVNDGALFHYRSYLTAHRHALWETGTALHRAGVDEYSLSLHRMRFLGNWIMTDTAHSYAVAKFPHYRRTTATAHQDARN